MGGIGREGEGLGGIGKGGEGMRREARKSLRSGAERGEKIKKVWIYLGGIGKAWRYRRMDRHKACQVLGLSENKC